jgi:hypothetical protein
MSARPYAHLLTEDLDKLSTSNWGNAEMLNQIASELGHRNRKRAKNLKIKLDTRLDELKKTSETFSWPSTQISIGENDGTLSEEAFPHVSGMLSHLEYRVGSSGHLAKERRQILDDIYLGSLPNVNSREYMEEWGTPKTAKRLKKLAETLAALTRTAKRKVEHDTSTAVEDWEADLQYLKKKYYQGHYDFRWPNTAIRG